MKVSIIIPTLNEELYIGKLLKSINAQSHKPFEVIIVDAHSKDNTTKIISSYRVIKLIKSKKPVSLQRSIGANLAKGDLLLFLDADVVLSKDFIKNSVQEIKKHKAEIACPIYIPNPGSFSINLFYSFFNKLFYFSRNHKPSGAGSCIYVTKKVYTHVGGFDSKVKFDDIFFIRQASIFGKFIILKQKIKVSDRRIRQYGILKSIFVYSLLSISFALENYDLSNKVNYKFGEFHNVK